MKKVRLWSTSIVLLLVGVLLASCQNAATTTKPATTTSATTAPPVTTTKPPAVTTTAAQSDKPQYGGTITVWRSGDILGFDEAFNPVWIVVTNHLTNDELLTGDWTKGPAGSNAYSWLSNGNYAWASKGASVAESWKIVEPGHMTFNIRKGIKYGLNSNSEASRLVNGRDLTGDDVAYSIDRMLNAPASYWKTAAPAWSASVKVTQPDKYTIDVAGSAVPDHAYNMAAYLVDFLSIIPKEVVAKYGDMRDWKNSVGSGPYFLTDFVSNSSATFLKNPKYWRTDPVGPGKGNQLPYADGIKVLVIPDTSTAISALRTGKIDILSGQNFDDARSVRANTPQLKSLDYTPAGLFHIYMRTDKQDLPYKDVRVRQALMMATDFDTIVKDLMGGKANKQSWPITPMPDFRDAYLPLDQAPQTVQDLYKYNPTKAKQLLKDAGYPSGFKAKIVVQNATAYTDYMSVVKGMWAKVGVDITIELVDFGVYNTRWAQRNFDELFYAGMASSGTYRRCTNYVGTGAGWNLSWVNDPKTVEARDKMVSQFNSGDDVGADKTNRDFMPYVLEQAWVIPTPVQDLTTFWWPWIKGYRGELSPGIINEWQETMYVWVDQEMKRQMGK
jgi:peptide/nickel transport system substrate-binding protein